MSLDNTNNDNINKKSDTYIKDLYIEDWNGNDTDFIYVEDIDLVQIRQHNYHKGDDSKTTLAEYGKSDLIEIRDWLTEIIKRMGD